MGGIWWLIGALELLDELVAVQLRSRTNFRVFQTININTAFLWGLTRFTRCFRKSKFWWFDVGNCMWIQDYHNLDASCTRATHSLCTLFHSLPYVCTTLHMCRCITDMRACCALSSTTHDSTWCDSILGQSLCVAEWFSVVLVQLFPPAEQPVHACLFFYDVEAMCALVSRQCIYPCKWSAWGLLCFPLSPLLKLYCTGIVVLDRVSCTTCHS